MGHIFNQGIWDTKTSPKTIGLTRGFNSIIISRSEFYGFSSIHKQYTYSRICLYTLGFLLLLLAVGGICRLFRDIDLIGVHTAYDVVRCRATTYDIVRPRTHRTTTYDPAHPTSYDVVRSVNEPLDIDFGEVFRSFKFNVTQEDQR